MKEYNAIEKVIINIFKCYNPLHSNIIKEFVKMDSLKDLYYLDNIPSNIASFIDDNLVKIKREYNTFKIYNELMLYESNNEDNKIIIDKYCEVIKNMDDFYLFILMRNIVCHIYVKEKNSYYIDPREYNNFLKYIFNNKVDTLKDIFLDNDKCIDKYRMTDCYILTLIIFNNIFGGFDDIINSFIKDYVKVITTYRSYKDLYYDEIYYNSISEYYPYYMNLIIDEAYRQLSEFPLIKFTNFIKRILDEDIVKKALPGKKFLTELITRFDNDNKKDSNRRKIIFNGLLLKSEL